MTITDFKTLSPELREQLWKLYEESFPAYERRSTASQARALDDKDAHSIIATDDNGTLLAFLFYWTAGNMVYGEFLAVNTSMRGRNIGSQIVERFLASHPGKPVILEIEPPLDELTVRRRKFYERLGFVTNPQEYTHPSYHTGPDAHPHRLVIMSHGRRVTDDEFAAFNRFMKDTVLKYVD